MANRYRYVVYQGEIYRLCAIGFDETLTDYMFHLQEAKDIAGLEEGGTIDVHSLLKAPMYSCRELEGQELEAARVLYDPKI